MDSAKLIAKIYHFRAGLLRTLSYSKHTTRIYQIAACECIKFRMGAYDSRPYRSDARPEAAGVMLSGGVHPISILYRSDERALSGVGQRQWDRAGSNRRSVNTPQILMLSDKRSFDRRIRCDPSPDMAQRSRRRGRQQLDRFGMCRVRVAKIRPSNAVNAWSLPIRRTSRVAAYLK